MELYEYSRSRLNSPMRAQFIKVLLKKSLRSMARTRGHNVNDSRWMRLFDLLCTTMSTQAEQLMLDLKAGLLPFEKTNKQGCLRIALVIDYITATKIYRDERRISSTLEANKAAFSSDAEWYDSFLLAAGYQFTDCGHVVKRGEAMMIRGNEETLSFMQHVCPACQVEHIQNNTRVWGHLNHTRVLILQQFAVEVRTAYGNMIMDSRTVGVFYNAERMYWQDSTYSPYQNLIGGYHSSRGNGFRIIDSPWLQSNRRAFGCELEVQVHSGDKNAKAGRVHEALNPSGEVGEYCFFERDGSIGDEAFELITQPAGLDVHREKFALFLNNPEIKRGLRSHEGGKCGFHVHVGRDYLTQGQIYRTQAFLNDVRNEALIRAIARRYSNGYCHYKAHLAKFTATNKHENDRYEALNTTNVDTVEFRIFRGSLRYESIMAALEFCNALLSFATPGVASLLEFNSFGFKQFVLRPENKADTKFLRAYLSLDSEYDNEASIAVAA